MDHRDFGQDIRLELGPGNHPTPGYIHLDLRALPDVEIVADVRRIPLSDGCVAELLASNILEHVGRLEVKETLREWARVVHKGGRVIIRVPDVAAIVKRYEEGLYSDESMIERLYGTQDYPENTHKTGFTIPYLTRLVQEAGFGDIRVKVIAPCGFQLEGQKL